MVSNGAAYGAHVVVPSTATYAHSFGLHRQRGNRSCRANLLGLEISPLPVSGSSAPLVSLFVEFVHDQVSVLKQALVGGGQDAIDDSGMTPLMYAAKAGRLSTAKYLMSQKASLIARHDASGFSPLHFAAFYCR